MVVAPGPNSPPPIRGKVYRGENVTISIGDMSTLAQTNASSGRFSPSVVELEKLPGWTRQNELYFAELGAIRLRLPATNEQAASERTLLEFVQSGANDGWVDFSVQDDTSVDFAGVVLCLEPPRGKGVSLARCCQTNRNSSPFGVMLPKLAAVMRRPTATRPVRPSGTA